MAETNPDTFPELKTDYKGTNGSAKPERRRPRRRSSGLTGEPRGDTGAAALATISSQHVEASAIGRESKLPRHSKRRKARTLLQRWIRLSLRHTWINPLVIILTILALYALNPTPSNRLHNALFLAYPIPSTSPVQYGKGGADFAFVAFYTIVFSFLREFLMQRLIRPLAIRWGITGRAKQARFMEQFYTALYFGVMGPFGLYVMRCTPVWYFRTRPMFEDFPHRQHEGLFKAYYLLQASYWAQQGLVLLLMLEKPRKDFKELVLHHVVTLALIWCSYRFHFTYMGIAVYITHDVSDFFLATSKVLNYLDSTYTAPYFAFFTTTWIYLRHYINLRILYAVLTEFRTVGPFELNWETQQYKCWISQYITFGLLATLQAVNLFWLYLILRIMVRTLTKADLRDDRSDSEDDEDESQSIEGRKDENGPVRQRKIKENGSAAPKVLVNGERIEIEDPPHLKKEK